MNCSIMNCKAEPKVGVRRIEDGGRTINYSVYCPIHAHIILYRCLPNEGERLEKVKITDLTFKDGRIDIISCDKQGGGETAEIILGY